MIINHKKALPLLFIVFILCSVYYYLDISLEELLLLDKEPADRLSKRSYVSSVNGTAVIAEHRVCNKFMNAIFNAVAHLPSNWNIQIFHSKYNEKFVREHPKLKDFLASGKVKMVLIPNEYGGEATDPYNGNTKDEYRKMFLNDWFWNQIPTENILTFQMDSRFCSNSPHRLDDFIHYSYVGAPWAYSKCWGEIIGVGQGGFSLRKKSVMLEILSHLEEMKKKVAEDPDLKECDGVDIAEDRVFSFGVYYLLKYLQRGGIVIPTKESAARFVQEAVPSEKPYLASLGVHGGHNSPGEFYQWCPEVRDAQAGCKKFDNYENEWKKT